MAVDVIDALVGVQPGSAMDAIRAGRPTARAQAQATYDALFSLQDYAGVSLQERLAVAAFVVGLHSQPSILAHYAAGLADAAPVHAAIAEAVTRGPYGEYPAGPLSVENVPGPVWQPSAALAAQLGPKLAAAFVHTHMLVFHPRDSSAAHLQALLDAGWGTTDVVTLSQLVSFLAFQIRTIAGLRVLEASL